jgi:antimicrobial peptide system SdpA family protein
MQNQPDAKPVKESARELRSLGAFVLLLLTGTYLLIAYAAYSALPHNPIKLPMEEHVRAVRWLPQGWKFFTRNPREEALLYFVRDEQGHWHSASLGPLSKPANAFGLDRRPRAQGVESALLLAGVRKDAWVNYRGKIENSFENLPVSKTVTNVSPRPTLKGFVGFAWQEPVPWPWLPSGDKVLMPCRVLKLKVE